MNEIPLFTIIVVTLAATFYCISVAERFVKQIAQAYVERGFRRIEKLHHDTHREIQTEFDFWWNGDPVQIVREFMRERVIVAGAPAEMQEAIRQPFVDRCRASALHLAIHARMTGVERRMIERLPRLYGLRDKMAENYTHHEEDLDGERTMLLESGINPEDLEKYFAPAA